jgi:lauroyl/myristoyl acyltransferase
MHQYQSDPGFVECAVAIRIRRSTTLAARCTSIPRRGTPRPPIRRPFDLTGVGPSIRLPPCRSLEMTISGDPSDDANPAAEGGGVELVSQSIHVPRAPAFAGQDLSTMLSVVALTPVALCLDDRYWPAVCRTVAGFAFARKSARWRRRQALAGLKLAFGTNHPAGSDAFDRIWRDLEAHRLELRLQIARDLLLRDWRPETLVEGAPRMEAALSAGHGAILWISRFAFADTIAKIGLRQIGHPPVHLSRTIHGFSRSRFGRRWLNPLQQRMENRYLAERVVLRDGAPSAAMRRLHGALAENRVVSITVDSWGAHVAEVPFLDGRLRIATGAPSLAWKTGAPLMPVYVLRETPSGVFRVTIDEPLAIDRKQSKSAAQLGAVAQYAGRLERHVAAYPGQWRDWRKLRPRA